MKQMKKVFVSGCYDILHAGHIQFFEDAKALGDHLIVCFASDEVLKIVKGRVSSMPEDNKMVLIKSLKMVDEVLKSSDLDPIFDFLDHIKRIRPNILAVTEDDKHQREKEELCHKLGIKLVVLPKRNDTHIVSSSSILRKIKGQEKVPLRIDFAGGWLDVPRLSKKGGFIVNCTISPLVSLDDWPYEYGGGLGGSAAKSILEMKNGVKSELDFGVGWQDPAVIEETGLCVWRSGKEPVLEAKYNPDWLLGKLLIYWTGKSHHTPGIRDKKRNYQLILRAAKLAAVAAEGRNLNKLAGAIKTSYQAQLDEGMDELPNIVGAVAKKYLGGGHGGYALYLFKNIRQRNEMVVKIKATKIIEPYIESIT